MARATVALVFLMLLQLRCPHATPVLPSPSNSNTTAGDEAALLSFKSSLSASTSGGSLASWNTSGRYCTWPGVVCGRRHPERVVALRLGSSGLTGRISPSLGNLSFLGELDLSDNQLTGEIPPELGRLSRLTKLNLSANLFLEGTIPVAIAGCTNLTVLDLSMNQLRGTIPLQIGASLKKLAYLYLQKNSLSGEITPSLANLPSIQVLYLKMNNLSGEIPPALGNLTNLRELRLSYNKLSGAIPSSFGQLSRLSFLSLGFNNLSGVIPTSVWNLSSLTVFQVHHNMLSGTIPPNAFNALLNLQWIGMFYNQFHGYFPASLTNASNLSVLQLTINYFSGIIPPEIGRLRNINILRLQGNFFEAQGPKDWEFLTALTNCSQLEILTLGHNSFGGVLPNSVSNLSSSLKHLSFSYNEIKGNIPKCIGNLMNLEILDLRQNSFTGSLPSSLSRLKKLKLLSVTDNKLSGSVPLEIGNLTELNHLYLDMNAFSARIPSTLGSLINLLKLDLGANNFSGQIPRELFQTPKHLLSLDLSDNNLEGPIPQEIGNLKDLITLHAGWNNLSGEIPSTLGECLHLENLTLQNNFLQGGIPSAMSELKGLEMLDLSSNNLSEEVPKFLGSLGMLQNLNLSFNNFVGELPAVGVFLNATAVSVQGNNKLCGGISDLHLPPCPLQPPKRRHNLVMILVVVSLVVATVAILSILCMLLSGHKQSKSKIPSTTSIQGHPKISYSQLIKATNGFSTTNLLGSGSFGSVYKGELEGQVGESTNLVAVKVLKLQTCGALKSFIAECEALRNLRHRNLVRIITACSSIDNRGNDFKAIVFDFMPNGSLQGWLYPDTDDRTDQKYLNIDARVNILLDVANALDYLHCHGSSPVIHCDIKPSNVLLDAEMVAHVGDFGLAKIIVDTNSSFQQSTSSVGFRGTIGYAPPEYGAGNMVSTQGDIHSYGILVLETVTGERPTDSEFIQGLSLREYVELGLRGRIMDVVDNHLCSGFENELQTGYDSSYKQKTDCLISLLKLGLCCSQEMPSSRMSTADIIKELRAIKESLPRD